MTVKPVAQFSPHCHTFPLWLHPVSLLGKYTFVNHVNTQCNMRYDQIKVKFHRTDVMTLPAVIGVGQAKSEIWF